MFSFRGRQRNRKRQPTNLMAPILQVKKSRWFMEAVVLSLLRQGLLHLTTFYLFSFERKFLGKQKDQHFMLTDAVSSLRFRKDPFWSSKKALLWQITQNVFWRAIKASAEEASLPSMTLSGEAAISDRSRHPSINILFIESRKERTLSQSPCSELSAFSSTRGRPLLRRNINHNASVN